jgi:hypothetical protein
VSIGATFRNGFAARAKDVPLIGLSGKPSAEFSFTPWLQPGDRGAQQKTVNRFNGFASFQMHFLCEPFCAEVQSQQLTTPST